jgi:hypothetical protein
MVFCSVARIAFLLLKKKTICHTQRIVIFVLKGNKGMLLCILAPVDAAAVLFALGYTNLAFFALVLLCPLMHLLSMQGHSTCCSEHGEQKQEQAKKNDGHEH